VILALAHRSGQKPLDSRFRRDDSEVNRLARYKDNEQTKTAPKGAVFMTVAEWVGTAGFEPTFGAHRIKRFGERLRLTRYSEEINPLRSIG